MARGPDASSTGSIEPGDVFLLNDPYEGGTHLPDFYIFKPIFVGGAARRLVGEHRPPDRRRRQDRRAATAATRPRSTRRASASRRSSSTSGGEPVEAIFELHRRRTCACRAWCWATCARRWPPASPASAATSRWSSATASTSWSPRAPTPCSTRRSAWRGTPSRPCPTASYTFTDHIDDDGLDPDPIPIAVTITVDGDRLIVDFDRLGAAGAGRDQLAAPVHQVRGLRVRPPPDRRRPAEQRGLLPPDRGRARRRARSSTRCCRRRSPRAG